MRLQGHHARWTTAFSLGDLQGVETHTCAGMRLYEIDHSGLQMRAYGSHDAGVCARSFRARAAATFGSFGGGKGTHGIDNCLDHVSILGIDLDEWSTFLRVERLERA